MIRLKTVKSLNQKPNEVQDRKRDMKASTDGSVEYHYRGNEAISGSNVRELGAFDDFNTCTIECEWSDTHQDRLTAIEPASSNIGIVAAPDSQWVI